MAYETFIQTIESSKLAKERDKNLVLVEHCSREYEGEIKKKGEAVRVKTLGTPTIYTLQKDGTYLANAVGAGSVAGKGKDVIHKGIPTAEEVVGGEFQLFINQINTFNVAIGDIDAEQGASGLMPKFRKKIAKGLANNQDKYVAKVMAEFTKSYVDSTDYSVTVSGTTTNSAIKPTYAETPASGETNVLDYIDYLVQKANENDIPDTEEFVLECSPKLWRYIKRSARDVLTDNVDLVNKRKFFVYNDVEIFKSNNTNVNSTEYAFFRTKTALTFACPITHTEAYRKENGFEDCIKGFNLFDCAIVEPKALIVTKIIY